MSEKKVLPHTMRELAVAGFEQINELCRRQEWMDSRRKILELSHEMAQRIQASTDDTVPLSDDDIRDILTALRYVQFAATSTTAYWEPLVTRLTEIADKRKELIDLNN